MDRPQSMKSKLRAANTLSEIKSLESVIESGKFKYASTTSRNRYKKIIAERKKELS